MKKKLLIIAAALMLTLSIVSTAFAADTGWKQIDGQWYYYEADGSLASGWKKIGSYWYYFMPDDHNRMACDSCCSDGKNFYKFDKNGHMLTNTWHKIPEDGTIYWRYYTSSGAEAEGWEKIGNYWYYFMPESGLMRFDGPFDIDENRYYFDENGHMASRKWISVEDETSGEVCWYYYKTNGMEASGWEKIGSYWYYFDPEDENVMIENERIEINDDIYRFDDKGHMITGWYQDEYADWYYFNPNGDEASGWKRVGSYWYYFKFDEGNRMLAGRWIDDGPDSYYLDKSGHMASNCWVQGYEDKWYYCKTDGRAASEWYKVGSYWYYFDPENEDVMVCDCTKTIDGVDYTFDASGRWIK